MTGPLSMGTYDQLNTQIKLCLKTQNTSPNVQTIKLENLQLN